ncbi:MAG: hypothetical protein NC131_18485 [Roseburia sp.]|nr:hypothetical protein [Roseburia sp.]
MQFEIDEKIIAKEMAENIYQYAYDTLKRDDFESWLYNSEVAKALNENIAKLVDDNKDKIINAIVELTANKIKKDISMRAILSLLATKE